MPVIDYLYQDRSRHQMNDLTPYDPTRALSIVQSGGFTGLLNDLSLREEHGVPEEVCDQIKATFERLTNKASEIPDRSLVGRPIYRRVEAMGTTYREWNDAKDPA